MARQYEGKIELDIRDSTPDWAPYLPPKAPDGAPNVLILAWDDVGYGAMDVFGGPIETPTMRRIADLGIRFSNFHTTALCSPTRASLLTGRNATSCGMATIAEFSSGFPGISTRIPFENGFISEVLAEQGCNTYCVGKWHLTPGEECNLAASKGRWPLGRGFERFYGWIGGETNSWYPDLMYDNHQIDPPGRPEDGYHLADDLADRAIEFIRDAKVIDPDKPFFMYLAPQAGHAPHGVLKEWADKYKGKFDQGYEAIRAGILEQQKKLGLLPKDTELSPINPHGEPERKGPDGQPWPALDTVRPWGSLSADEQRLFTRMAEVFAGYISYYDDRLGRVIDYLEQSGELENTIIVVVGVRHAVPVLEALGGLRGRRRRRVPRRLAEADQGLEGGASPVRARGRRGPDALRAARHRAARGAQGLHAEPARGRELCRRAHRREGAGQAHAVLHDARQPLDLPPGLARDHGAPAAVGVGQVRARRVGALRPRARPVAVEGRGRPASGAARDAEEPVVLLRGHLQRPAVGRPLGARAGARRAAARGAGPSAVHLLPEHRGCPRVRRRGDQRPVLHDRGGCRDRVERCRGRHLRPRGHRRRPQPLREGQVAPVPATSASSATASASVATARRR